jgi:subtilisin family serine protease
VLDSGFRTTHKAFAKTNIVATFDFVKNDTIVDNQPGDAASQFHHGTQVLSTIAAQDEGFMYGAAYNASFLLAKTESLDFETIQEEDFFMMGVEWAERLGADVLSSSLGYRDWWQPSDFDGLTAITTRAINSAIEKGVSCVVSAGNDGTAGLSVPADAFYVITAGSVNAANQLSPFSSRGPTYDGRIKPEVVAMGGLTAVVAPTSSNSYTTNSGTSFSCPLVAGAVALLLSAHPDLTPIEIRTALIKTAGNAASPNNELGWGLVNVVAAIDYATGMKNQTHPVIDCDCSNNGVCVDGICQCYAGYSGKKCEIPRNGMFHLAATYI